MWITFLRHVKRGAFLSLPNLCHVVTIGRLIKQKQKIWYAWSSKHLLTTSVTVLSGWHSFRRGRCKQKKTEVEETCWCFVLLFVFNPRLRNLRMNNEADPIQTVFPKFPELQMFNLFSLSFPVVQNRLYNILVSFHKEDKWEVNTQSNLTVSFLKNDVKTIRSCTSAYGRKLSDFQQRSAYINGA